MIFKKLIAGYINNYIRGLNYINLIRSIAIGVILCEQFDLNRKHYIWIIPTTIIVIFLLGVIEKCSGFYSEILKFQGKKHPLINNINNKINELYIELIKNNTMEKLDILNGSLITFRNGMTSMLFKNYGGGSNNILIPNIEDNHWDLDNEFDNDLKHINRKDFDIIEIRHPINYNSVIYYFQQRSIKKCFTTIYKRKD